MKLLLFELDHRGHHPGYLQHLVKYWCTHQLSGHLDVLVSRKFADQHPQIVDLGNNQHRVKFILITPEEQNQLFNSNELGDSFIGRIKRAFQEFRLLSRYTKALGTTHCFLMYLDTILLRLAISSKLPCRFSCIYFRPIFHYPNFPSYTSKEREWLWRWRDQVCLPRLLNSPYLDTLFCLDPIATEELNRMGKSAKAIHLPDPVAVENLANIDYHILRESLGIDRHRQVFLLFGALHGRKGIYQLLDAIAELPSDLCQKLCLLLVGGTDATEQAKIKSKLKPICQTKPIQIIERYEFVPEPEVSAYFQLADVVLAPYQRHVGMSGILLLAAAAGKPVLSSNYGLMGEMVRRYELGLSIDSTISGQIAEGICRFLQASPEALCNRTKINEFAQNNRVELFAEKIFKVLTNER